MKPARFKVQYKHKDRYFVKIKSMRVAATATNTTYQQDGISTIKAVAAIAGIGLTLLFVFIFIGGAGSPKVTNNNAPNTDGQSAAAPASQPNFIRIPENYSVYTNKDYKFSFAYPTPWANSISVKGLKDANFVPISTKFAFFTNYALGSSVLNGQLLVNIDNKDAFKILTHPGGAVVAPVKLGDGYGWKVVQAGTADSTLKVGDSYNVKSAKYQSGVTIYNLAVNGSNSVQSRWVLQSGDNFVGISLPILSHVDGSAPSTADIALYTAISNNVAKTARPTN